MRIHLLLFFGLSFLLSTNHFGQTIVSNLDSLIQQSEKMPEDIEKAKNLHHIAFTYITRREIGKSINYGKQAQRIAEGLNDEKLTAKIEFDLAQSYLYRLSEFDSVDYYLNRAERKFKAIGNRIGIAKILEVRANKTKRSGDLDKAINILFEALNIYTEENALQKKLFVQLSLSKTLVQLERYEEALEYQNLVYEGYKEAENLGKMAETRADMSYVLTQLGRSEKAVQYADEAIKFFTGKNPMRLGLAHQYKSMALEDMGDMQKSLKELQKGYDLIEPINNPQLLRYIANNLSDKYMKMDKFEEALPLLKKGFQEQKGVERREDFELILTKLASCYAGLEQYDSAYYYMSWESAYKDSLRREETNETLSELKTKFETKEKEATIEEQKSEISEAKKIQYLSFGIATLLAAFLVGLFYFFRKNQKQNVLIQKKNAQNELLLKEIHHRVKNNLETVSSLLALQSATIEDPTVLDAMLESQNRVQSMGMIHQKLYQGENLASIEMKDYFLNLSEGILDSFGAEGRVQVECAMQELELDVDTAVPIGLIVNELLTNSLKYAFPDGQNGKISISLKEKNADNLELTISDNGIGKNTISAQKSKGFGTQLIQLLTTQINGTLEEIVNQGTMVSLTFKRTNLA